nr:hypothetical protein [Tanacetum cinerariifolium]
MLYQVDTARLASLVRAKRGGQTLREAAEEITKTVGPVSVGTLLRVEQQRMPDLPVFLHFCNWLNVSPARLLYCPSSPAAAPADWPPMSKPPKEPKGEKGLTVVAADRPTLALAADLASRVAPNVERYLLRGLEGSDNTRLAYSADLRSYEAYCELHQLGPWPAALETLASYVAHLADVGRKLATINRHLAAIEKNHQLLGLPSAINAPALDVLRKGVAREIGKKQKQAPAFSVPHLKRTIDRLDLSRPDGLRVRALLLLGFAGAFRRSELVDINLEHLEMVHDATDEVLVITLPKSKANQAGEVEQKIIFYSENPAY